MKRQSRTRDQLLTGARFRFGSDERSGWIQVPFGDGWIAAHRLMRQSDGAIVVGEIRIYPNGGTRLFPVGTWAVKKEGMAARVPLGGLSAAIIRRAPIGHHLAVLGDYVQWVQAEGLSEQSALLEKLGFITSAQPQAVTSMPNRRGRPQQHSDLYLARLAKTYVLACGLDSDTGKPRRNPIAKIAAMKGARLTPTKVRMLIGLARKRGFLTGSGGHPGGVLTSAARAVLNTQQPTNTGSK